MSKSFILVLVLGCLAGIAATVIFDRYPIPPYIAVEAQSPEKTPARLQHLYGNSLGGIAIWCDTAIGTTIYWSQAQYSGREPALAILPNSCQKISQ